MAFSERRRVLNMHPAQNVLHIPCDGSAMHVLCTTFYRWEGKIFAEDGLRELTNRIFEHARCDGGDQTPASIAQDRS